MILCKHCGWPVTNVLVNCFNHDGSDTYQLFPISEPHGLDGIAEFFVPTTWTGYDLSDEERMETIKCHHCNKYPFDEKEGVNAKALIDVVCFEEGGRRNTELNDVSTIKAYRVENQKDGHGIWRNFDGTLNPVFSKLSDGFAKSLPMPDSDFYREGGKQWFSATDTPEKLTAWFSRQDVLEMLAMGYEVYEFEITGYRTVSEYEIVFTRDSIVSQRAVDYSTIWKEG